MKISRQELSRVMSELGKRSWRVRRKQENTRKHLAEIGRKGGKKSRKTGK